MLDISVQNLIILNNFFPTLHYILFIFTLKTDVVREEQDEYLNLS